MDLELSLFSAFDAESQTLKRKTKLAVRFRSEDIRRTRNTDLRDREVAFMDDICTDVQSIVFRMGDLI